MKKVLVGLCITGLMLSCAPCSFAANSNYVWSYGVPQTSSSDYGTSDTYSAPVRNYNTNYYDNYRRNDIRYSSPKHKNLPVKGRRKFMCLESSISFTSMIDSKFGLCYNL